MKTIRIAIGAKLKKRRTELGISQAQLAGALGVSVAQIQKYELGVNAVPACVLYFISNVLDTHIGDFFVDLPVKTAPIDLSPPLSNTIQ